MLPKEQIIKKLKKEIDEERFQHTMRVAEVSKKLAREYNVNIEKAEISALLHDCAKYKDKSILLKKAYEFGIILDNVFKDNTNIIHGLLGAEIAKSKYNVLDKDILNAIRYHTIGRKNMTILEKIIFISDYIEPDRNFEGIKKVRDLAEKDIDKAIILAIDKTIKYLIYKGETIHPNTIKTRNQLLMQIKK